MAGGKRSERSHSEARSLTSSDCSAGRSGEKRQRFEAARRAHYNMREALRLGRQLTSASGDNTKDPVARDPKGSDDEDDDHMKDCGSSRLQAAPEPGSNPPGEEEGSGEAVAAAGEPAAQRAPENGGTDAMDEQQQAAGNQR